MEKNKRMKKGNQNKKVIIFILICLIIGSCVYLGIRFFKNPKSNASENVLENITIDETKITEEVSQRMLQLQELQKENEDIVGYIEVEGTNISYPVLQAKDNDYYMKKNYKKEYSYDGSIFLDAKYDWEKPSSNLLIYGHNNKNDKMFAQLLKYEKEEFYKEHPIINFTTDEEDAKYEIIAVFKSRVYYKSEKNVFRYYYFVDADTEKEYNEYVNQSLKASLYDTGKAAEYGEQLLTLSTCSYHTEDGRFAVVARKIKKD